ncbi:Protein farnesyltransferase/geranylgeranyltransferase type-1 subunit alpha [Striga hermonthica]|uniref:Protein farnesyltransferase/geranylgeranyltransferase type-1 subunit alpha n=1 Tax=Striga hermonthica TaxID=68872 RepID=A0A9N7NTR1_STRHE|nr:Protein farnesyltransferase/geranylgeranyltransferase type-1 subunit alpha [Striga hermonthica]
MYVKDFGIDTIEAELRDVTDVLKCRDNMHAWCYRQWLVAEKNPNGFKSQFAEPIIREECKLTGQVLADNIKSIYAWSHRKWTMERFGGWKDELVFCRQLLENDIRNTLAWNQKTFIIMRWGQQVSQEIRELELEFTEKAIYKDRESEHPWMYLTCLYQAKPFVHQSIDLIYESLTWATMRDPIDVFMNRRWCVNVLDTLLHLTSLGYKPNEKVRGAVFRLCSNIKLAADITDGSLCFCAVTDNKCETCRFCLILILQHVDLEGHHPWEVVY